MKNSMKKRLRGALMTAAVSAVAVGTAAIPAYAGSPAATTGWWVAYSHQYSPAWDNQAYTSLAVVGKGDAWALGTINDVGSGPGPGAAVAVHWNGKDWTSKPMPSGVTGTIMESSVLSSKDIWAVTDSGGNILHWNGSKWLLAKHLTPSVEGSSPLLSGVTAINDDDIWVFGVSPIAAVAGFGTWHYNGHTWSQVTGLDATVLDASATSASNIWGVTYRQVDHYNGHSWQDATPASVATQTKAEKLLLESTWAASSTSTWVAAAGDPGVTDGARLWDVVKGSWKAERLPWAADDLGQLTPDGSGGFFVRATSGGTTWFWHRTAKGQWTRIASVPDSRIAENQLNFVVVYAPVPKTTSLWAVGAAHQEEENESIPTVWAEGPTH